MPVGDDPHSGRPGPGRALRLGTQQIAQPVNLPEFLAKLNKLIVGLMKQGAHCEVAVSIQGGELKQTRVHRSFQPGNLPDVP
jgi:hypothetical protein